MRLERQFNILQKTPGSQDTNLESITGGKLTTLIFDAGKWGVAPFEATKRLGLVTQHPFLQHVCEGFKEHEWELTSTLFEHPTTLVISDSTDLPKASAELKLGKAESAPEPKRPPDRSYVDVLEIEEPMRNNSSGRLIQRSGDAADETGVRSSWNCCSLM